MKSILALGLVFMMGAPALASDSWDSCSNSEGTVKLSYDNLTVGEDEIAGPVKVLSRKVLEKKTEKCMLKNHKSRVIAFMNEVSIEKISYTYMNTKMTAWVVCERGGSGIPANDSCQD